MLLARTRCGNMLLRRPGKLECADDYVVVAKFSVVGGCVSVDVTEGSMPVRASRDHLSHRHQCC